MKKKILILTGAGLTAGENFFGITTSGLTKDFVSYHHPDLTDDKELMFFIYSEFCFWNKLDPVKIDDNLSQINFETILQMIEELFSYVEDVERTHHKLKFQNSVKNTIYSLNRRLIFRIGQVRTQNRRIHPISLLRKYITISLTKSFDKLILITTMGTTWEW